MDHPVSTGDMHNMPGGHSQLLHSYIASLMPMSTELPWTRNTWVFGKTQSEYKYRVVAGKQLPRLGLHSETSPKECERKQYVLYLIWGSSLPQCTSWVQRTPRFYGWLKHKDRRWANQKSQHWTIMWVKNESLLFQALEIVGFICYCSLCFLWVHITAES